MNDTIKKVNRIANINIKLEEPNIYNIRNILRSEGSVILLYHWQKKYKQGEHYILIESIDNHKYKIVNHSFQKNIHYITSRELRTMLLPFVRDNNEFPRMWHIKN